MANEYTPTVWRTGDIITAEKLNKIEEGIAGAPVPTPTVAEITVNLLVDSEPPSAEFLERIEGAQIRAYFVDSNENQWFIDDETDFLSEPFTIDIYNSESGVTIKHFVISYNDTDHFPTNVSVSGDITYNSGFNGGWIVKGNGTITIGLSNPYD